MAMIKPIYNAERLVLWPMINEAAETYGNPIDFTDRLMTYDDNVAVSTSKFYGDGKPIIVDVDEDSGTLVLGIAGLHGDEFANLFDVSQTSVTINGQTFSIINENGEEVPPYFCVALMAQTDKNVFNLRKWPKVRFQKIGESVQQKTNTRTYSTPTLNGEFIKCNRLGIKRSRCTDVNITTTAGIALVNNWFGAADWFGGTTTFSDLKCITDFARSGAISLNDGDTILVGDTIKAIGAASGGTAAYTYENTVTIHTSAVVQETVPAAGYEVQAAGTYTFKSVVTDGNSNTAERKITVIAVAASS